MKNVLFRLLFSGLLTFIGCSKESTDSTKKVNPLIGTWVLDRIEVNGKIEEVNDCERNNSYTFAATSVVKFQNSTSESNCISTAFEGEWKQEENGLIKTRYDEIRGIGFILLNDNEMEIEEIIDIVLRDGIREERIYVYLRKL